MISMVDIRRRLGSDQVRQLVDQLEYPLEIREAKTAQILNEYLDHPEQPIFGAESQGELVGFIGLRLQPPDGAVIRHIAVSRDLRGQGIGGHMIAQVRDICRLGTLFAETDRDAVEFYRKAGFTVQSLGEKYQGTERFSCTLTRQVQST